MFGRKPRPAWGVDLSDISAILSRLVPPAGALPAGSRPACPGNARLAGACPSATKPDRNLTSRLPEKLRWLQSARRRSSGI